MYSSNQKEIYCSFCRRAESQVQHLIKGRGVYVCNECVHQFKNLLKQSPKSQDSACNCSQHTSNQIVDDK